MTSITASLSPMTASDFESYRDYAHKEYAKDKMKATTLTEAEAMKLSVESFAKLLPEGLETPDNYLFNVVAEDSKQGSQHSQHSQQKVGILWFSKRQDYGEPFAWVFDIELDPAYRGQGLGKQTMALLEAEVRKLGLKTIRLHVFGHNTTATSLYQKTGYQITDLTMAKTL